MKVLNITSKSNGRDNSCIAKQGSTDSYTIASLFSIGGTYMHLNTLPICGSLLTPACLHVFKVVFPNENIPYHLFMIISLIGFFTLRIFGVNNVTILSYVQLLSPNLSLGLITKGLSIVSSWDNPVIPASS